MSKKGSELPVQLNDSDISQHSVRKRASPNNINTRKDLTVCATTLIAAVGSSSSKVRRISHPPTDQASNTVTSEGLEERVSPVSLAGPSGIGGSRTPVHSGEASAESSKSNSGQRGRTSDGVAKELRYLTDFFPDQLPTDRRLTRSQRQLSAPTSPIPDISGVADCSVTPESNISSPGSHGSVSREKVRGRKGRSSGGASRFSVVDSATTENRRSTATGDLAGSSGLASTSTPLSPPVGGTQRIQLTTGICSSSTRCEGSTNRVFPCESINRPQPSDVSADAASSSHGQDFSHRNEDEIDVVNNPGSGTFSGSALRTTNVDPSQSLSTASTNTAVVSGSTASSIGASVPMCGIGSIEMVSFQSATSEATHGTDSHATTYRSTPRSAGHTAASFLGALVPRMQHLLAGTHSHQNVRVVAIMEGLRSSNEIRQAEAASELAEMLLLGNEESLPNLPIKDIVHALILLLQKEHNFELMLTAARCISNMLEALPRALPIVVDAVPCLLEKLKRIECIDVAEQSLMALEVMSKRNGKNIMAAGGIAATISHVDFFSVPSQRLAFQIAANCAMYVTVNDFSQIRDSLADLTQRLLIEDKRCLESVCILFCRLVDNLRNHAEKLREIAGPNHALLKNAQQLLLVQPPAVGPSTFQSLVRMLRNLAAKCSDLAVALINMDFARTIRFLIVGSEDGDYSLEMVNRPPGQLQELVFLAGELLPRLPMDGIFEINGVMSRSHVASHDLLPSQWYWKDDSNQWQPFSNFESGVIEMAHAASHPEISLKVNGNLYRIEFQNMIQQDPATGKERAIQRRPAQLSARDPPVQDSDRRLSLLKENPTKFDQVVRLLFPILVEIDGSSSGPALRYESLRVMLRMIQSSSPGFLKGVLSELPLAGHIASALASPRSKDLCVVASALQLCHLLLEKMSDVYIPLFTREGVAHEVEKLTKMKMESPATLPPVRSSPSVIASSSRDSSQSRTRGTGKNRSATMSASPDDHFSGRPSTSRGRGVSQPSTSGLSNPGPSDSSTQVIVSSSGGRHRRKASPESPISKKESRRKGSSSSFLHGLRLPSFRMPGQSTSHSPHEASSPNTAITSFFSSIGSTPNSLSVHTSGHSSSFGFSLSSSAAPPQASMLNHQQREKVRQWIRREAEHLMRTYLSCPDVGADSAATSTLARMSAVATALSEEKDVGSAPLNELKAVLQETEVSAFELNYSGVLMALTTYLTSLASNLTPPRKLRLKRFAAVFMSLTPDNLRPLDGSGCWVAFETLITKLLASVAQLEQFQVKVTDMGGALTSGSTGVLRGAQALRFFQTHQIRCNLRRHPTCRELREWRRGRGSIKVDPFTSISAIEKYLLDRGVGYVRGDESSGDEDVSDEDEMPSEGSMSSGAGQQRHIDIMIGDEVLPGHMSILQAIRQYSPAMNSETSDQFIIATDLWVSTHTLYYRAAAAPSETPVLETQTPKSSSRSERKERKTRIDERLWIDGEVPKPEHPLDGYLSGCLPVDIDDPSVPSLVLLRCLYGLNRYWWCLFDDEDVPPTSHAPLLPDSSFHSSKLNAKIGRQLSDFLSVATQQIPKWTSDLVKAVPFIFTFSARRNLLYCSAFGRDRALMHLVNQTDGGHSDGESGRLTPRLERRKVSIRRDDLLRQAEQALNHLGTSRAMLEVGFEGEAGTGFGPTLEFYSTVSHELQKASLRLWQGRTVATSFASSDDPSTEYVMAENGLFPAFHSTHNAKQRDTRLKKFEFIGRLLAQALLDARMLDLSLNPVFFKWLCGGEKSICLADLEMYDKSIYSSLRALLLTDAEDFSSLEQYFTMPGDETFELIKGGKNHPVDRSNVSQFVKLVCHWRLVEGVRREMEAVRHGFETIINIEDLAFFLPEEMEELFCGCSDDTWTKTWSQSSLQTAIKPDHGYNHDSDQIRWLIHMLASFDFQQQRKFLQFVTGSPKLPVGGFRSLNPPLTVVKKSGSYGNGDDELPSAMTCYNYLKIPAYSSYDIFKERFSVALRFIYSFHLT